MPQQPFNPNLRALIDLYGPKSPRPPVVNADGISGPATVTGGFRGEDIDLPSEPFEDDPSSMVPLSASPYRQQPPAQEPPQSPPSTRFQRPDPGPAIRSLQSLNQNDPSSELYQLQQERGDEAEDRAFANQRAGVWSPHQQDAAGYLGESDAFRGLAGQYKADIAKNPITQQLGEVEDYRNREREAVLGGFQGGSKPGGVYQNPIQAQAQTAREMETAKINAPIEAQRMAGQYNLAQEQERSRGAEAVAKTYAPTGGFGGGLQGLLNQAQGAGMDISHISLPTRSGGGGLSFTQPKQIPPAVTQAILVARRNYEAAKASNHWYTPGDPVGATKKALDQAIATGLYNYPTDDLSLKQYIQGILSDPNAENMSLQQILAAKGDDATITPEEQNELQQMLSLFRGY